MDAPSPHFYDPRRGEEPVRLDRLILDGRPFEPERTNCFTIHWIESGSGQFWADATRFEFQPNSLLFFVPYQHVRLVPRQAVQGTSIRFHANFLCVETFHAEVGCSGILFNDPHGIPIVSLSDQARPDILHQVARLQDEQTRQQLAFREVMLAELKVLLILATRVKTSGKPAGPSGGTGPQHPVVLQFRELIEQHYRELHSPSDYAERLHVSAKTLGRIVRETLGTTPMELIRSRILTHVKWQLLHTLRSVKEIAREVGFRDELYFSRVFRKATGCSPRFFREFETEIRGGSNLSMLSSEASIPNSSDKADSAL
jgi:AraC-like DNA-binding protein